jgi:hypothetical protein
MAERAHGRDFQRQSCVRCLSILMRILALTLAQKLCRHLQDSWKATRQDSSYSTQERCPCRTSPQLTTSRENRTNTITASDGSFCAQPSIDLQPGTQERLLLQGCSVPDCSGWRTGAPSLRNIQKKPSTRWQGEHRFWIPRID